MKNIWFATLAAIALVLSVTAKAAETQFTEASFIVKCQDAHTIAEAADELNGDLLLGTIYGGTGDGKLLRIQKPFSVSAPAVGIQPSGVVRVCVTVTKQ